jgi:HSP20 family protein
MLIPIRSYRDPFGEMRGLLRQVDEVFRDFDRPARGRGPGLVPDAWPSVDLRDDGEELVIQADVPGMTDKDISIEATGQSLTIRGERQIEPPEGYQAHRRERTSVKFARSFALPHPIDLDAVTASVKNGVLTVRATKLAEARPKQIAVKAS